ncbi:protein phosphatase 1 regulatory subunit 42 isoform X2 [Betta splendens]|uniref:Protein phosphatase 1 regulatory subunit 42 isoform X2 n=1 Tax=Betta splendens TaxID=158456 RepID=A0A6P7MF81_BETSP|nr:protein phosphatase 1 regulatory subunit 42 isoform X2 [Betta splendens]
MVLLTIDLIAKSPKHFKKKRGLSLPDYLQTLTHLHFSSRNIEDIITHISNIGFASNLTHLYMQNNNITHIDNLSNLQKLSKLYLGGNRIAVVEGLEQLPELKELHLENQRLAPGEKLLFDPRTLASVAESLSVLNINTNNIDDIRDISILKELQYFSAAGNKLHNIEELQGVCSHWPQLLQMDLRGNPVCKTAKYRDCLITVCESLEVLDGREINEVTRQFLINWKASKEAKKKNSKHMLPGPMIPYPVINDFNSSQGPHSHIQHRASVQQWRPQHTLRAKPFPTPVSGLLTHAAVPTAQCSSVDA